MSDHPQEGPEPSIVECRFCGNRHGVRYYCDATEHALDASEAALRHADQINGELAQENNYLSDELATAVEMNKRLVKESDRSRLPVRGYERRWQIRLRGTPEARHRRRALEEP